MQCKTVLNIEILEDLEQQTTITSNFLLKIFFLVQSATKREFSLGATVVTESEPSIRRTKREYVLSFGIPLLT